MRRAALVQFGLAGWAIAAGDVVRDCSYRYEDVLEAQTDQGYPIRTIAQADIPSFRKYLNALTGGATAQLLAASVVQREDGPSAIVWTLGGCTEQITLAGSIERLSGWDR